MKEVKKAKEDQVPNWREKKQIQQTFKQAGRREGCPMFYERQIRTLTASNVATTASRRPDQRGVNRETNTK